MQITFTRHMGVRYVNIKTDKADLMVRTRHGTAKELCEYADQLERDINRNQRKVSLIRAAARQMSGEPCPKLQEIMRCKGEVT